MAMWYPTKSLKDLTDIWKFVYANFNFAPSTLLETLLNFE